MTHYVRFTRSNVTGETVASCTCGAMHTNDRLTCAQWANYHLDKQGLDELKPLPKAKPGFVSGIADK